MEINEAARLRTRDPARWLVSPEHLGHHTTLAGIAVGVGNVSEFL
jgi:hypothetical protein